MAALLNAVELFFRTPKPDDRYAPTGLGRAQQSVASGATAVEMTAAPGDEVRAVLLVLLVTRPRRPGQVQAPVAT
jgi:hypothetical protein